MIHLLCEIAVIGAGLAGLAAAHCLQSQGYDVKAIAVTPQPTQGLANFIRDRSQLWTGVDAKAQRN